MPPLDIRQWAIALLDQLPQNKLAAVVQLLEVLDESPNPSQFRRGSAISHHSMAATRPRAKPSR